MKCVQSSLSTQQLFSCPIRLIEQLDIIHPYHFLIIETLNTFHHKYNGCSSKTLLFFLTKFYHQFQILFNKTKNNLLIEKNFFSSLEQLIEQSKFISQKKFIENLSLNFNILLRICRNQTIYADCLYQAYLYFISLHEHFNHTQLISYFDHLDHVTYVKYSQEKCLFIPGTIIPIEQSIKGCRRTVLIDGHIFEDYVHLGYNNKIKLKQISLKSTWFYLILSILEKYSIEIIICSGTIDQNLKEFNFNKYIFIENCSFKFFQLFDKNFILNYLTDINDDHILVLNYIEYRHHELLTIIDKGSTIMQYVPLENLTDVKHEQFQHCLARFRWILHDNFYLKGSGEFEKCLYEYWYEKRNENLSNEYSLAYECFLECLQLFFHRIFQSKECFEKNFIDDFHSKFDAWQTSIELLKVLMQIDDIVQIIDNDDLSDI